MLVGGLDLISIDGKYKIYSRGNIIKMTTQIVKMIDQDIGELKITFVNLEGTKS